MLEALIISLAVIIIFSAAVIESKKYYCAGLVGAIGGALLVLGISISFEKDTPTALDVYQGKTTLEITYRDSIPVDSTVIFVKTNK